MKYIFALLMTTSVAMADSGHNLSLILFGDNHTVNIIQEGQPSHTAEVMLTNGGGSFLLTVHQQDNVDPKIYAIEGICFVSQCEWIVYQ
jgi:hypothetical protein